MLQNRPVFYSITATTTASPKHLFYKPTKTPTFTLSSLVWNKPSLSQVELCPKPPAMRLISTSLHKLMAKTNQHIVWQIINPTSGESPWLLLELQLQELLQDFAKLNLRPCNTAQGPHNLQLCWHSILV